MTDDEAVYTHSPPGKFEAKWAKVNYEYTCPKCNSTNLEFRKWESSDGAHEDVYYRCHNGHQWWIEGIDS